MIVCRWKTASPSGSAAGRVQDHARQVADMVDVQVGKEHGLKLPEVEPRVDVGRRRPPSAVDEEDLPVDDERGRRPAAPGDRQRRPSGPQQHQLGGHAHSPPSRGPGLRS
jgi:hypothetical protein